MNTITINYKFSPGDPVWFFHNNNISKGVVNRVEIIYTSKGLSSRGYKVKEFFNRILQVPKNDKILTGDIRYSINLLNYNTEDYKSSPHLFNEDDNLLFRSKEELIKSL